LVTDTAKILNPQILIKGLRFFSKCDLLLVNIAVKLGYGSKKRTNRINDVLG
jgi:hypothetical protein